MRTIKFRAWERGKMYNDLAYITMKGGGFSANPDVPLIRPVLMQFTGLHDQHGVEIYEGDIMQFPEGIAKVIWDDAAFALQSPGSQAVDYEHSSVFESGKVIGNIYQNPQLFDI